MAKGTIRYTNSFFCTWTSGNGLGTHIAHAFIPRNVFSTTDPTDYELNCYVQENLDPTLLGGDVHRIDIQGYAATLLHFNGKEEVLGIYTTQEKARLELERYVPGFIPSMNNITVEGFAALFA
jgi:hypothetical protein